MTLHAGVAQASRDISVEVAGVRKFVLAASRFTPIPTRGQAPSANASRADQTSTVRRARVLADASV